MVIFTLFSFRLNQVTISKCYLVKVSYKVVSCKKTCSAQTDKQVRVNSSETQNAMRATRGVISWFRKQCKTFSLISVW